MGEHGPDKKAVIWSRTWRDLEDWTKAEIQLRSDQARDDLDGGNFEYRRGYRDAFEDVWLMLLAFRKDAS